MSASPCLRGVLRSCCLICALALGGCDWLRSESDVEVDTDAVAESADNDKPSRTASISSPAEQKLTLNLKVGDRFPLLKVVEQQLTQPSPRGPTTSRSRLELKLMVTLQEIYHGDTNKGKDPREGQKRFQVRYHQVKFSQDLPGHALQYDSDRPPSPLPLEAQVYHGLKDNHFEFWIGADNQILELIGFKPFLERCLKDVLPAQKQQVWDMLAAATGADGIANFVDDSIGLLPPDAVRLGDTWTNSRSIPQPVPMRLNSKYTLRQITPQTAEVDIVGTITPSATYGPGKEPGKDVQVIIRGGNCVGSCLIDRRTGLPVQSKVEQTMQMAVRMSGGIEFEQQKTTITTIRAFPQEGPPQPAGVATRG